MLDVFIKKFVLCPGCDNPETVLTVWKVCQRWAYTLHNSRLLVFQVYAKKQTISQSCKACGYNGQLDMRHKLTTFILKNPPGTITFLHSIVEIWVLIYYCFAFHRGESCCSRSFPNRRKKSQAWQEAGWLIQQPQARIGWLRKRTRCHRK